MIEKRFTMMRLLILLTLLATPLCYGKVDIESLSNAYFKTYQARKDLNQFIAFYDDNAIVDDLVFGNLVSGKANIRAFFDWEKGDVTVLNNRPTLSIESQLIDNLNVVTKGVFNQFTYQGKKMGPWRFVIWHTYNEKGKIIYQEDWINYTPKKDFLGGKNRNPLIL